LQDPIARISPIAEVAQAYLDARGLQRRLAVLEAGIATLRQLETYVEARFQAGQASALDLSRVRERLQAQQAERSPLIEGIEMGRRRLAILCGRPPEAVPAFSRPGEFAVPGAPGGQMPGDVLERRPDIRGRADLVRAQAARLASARTDLLPSFSIEFLGQDGHLSIGGLPGVGGTVGLVGLSAHVPIFTAGRIQANIEANDARLEAASAAYDKALLQALGEVEDSYGLRHAFDRRAADQAAALILARRNEELAERLYEGGRRTLQDVLEARLDADKDEDALRQTQSAQTLATIQLYLALGGGWSAE
jgi:outer membrane protein TolC